MGMIVAWMMMAMAFLVQFRNAGLHVPSESLGPLVLAPVDPDRHRGGLSLVVHQRDEAHCAESCSLSRGPR